MHDLTGMAVFARVVEARGFSAAARALGMSKSAVSKEVARLEDRLGVRLLNRTTRRLTLTEAGALYYERSARVVREAAEAEQAVHDLGSGPRGLLRLNAPMSFGLLHLAPAVADFLGRHPGLRIELVLEDRVVDVVGEGFDLVVRIADLPPSSLVARRLAVNRRIVCAAPAYLAAHGKPEVPQDLARHNCLNYFYLASGDVWRFRGTDGPLTVRISGSLSANNGEVLRQAAVAGLGIVLSPTFLIGRELESGALVPILEEYWDADTGIYAVYPPTRHVSSKVRAFIDFLVERFGPEPYWDAACPRVSSGDGRSSQREP